MVVIEVSFEITRWFILCIIGARLSRSLHNSLVTKVMNSPVYMYFSVTPLGKLLKHFTKDVDNCDRDFFGTMEWIIRSLVDCLFKIGFALVFSPYLGIMAMMNFVGMREIYNYTKEGNTEFRRIQSKQDTKMSTHSNETADGMTIIRAFSK
jgi:ABC-type multidrug transport system fused ATPase/permease subunit